MPFIDRGRFNKGVSFDAKYQIIHFAWNGDTIEPKALSKAIRDAGFKPATLYSLSGSTLKKTSLE